jgi:hypothetical protein
MFSSVEAGGQVGEVKAYTTSGRGLNVEELADMAMRKLIHVADTAAPALQDQARMFKQQVRALMIAYMHQAIKSDRTTLYNKLRDAGNSEIAEIILRI